MQSCCARGPADTSPCRRSPACGSPMCGRSVGSTRLSISSKIHPPSPSPAFPLPGWAGIASVNLESRHGTSYVDRTLRVVRSTRGPSPCMGRRRHTGSPIRICGALLASRVEHSLQRASIQQRHQRRSSELPFIAYEPFHRFSRLFTNDLCTGLG
jgi:hypothetical protein